MEMKMIGRIHTDFVMGVFEGGAAGLVSDSAPTQAGRQPADRCICDTFSLSSQSHWTVLRQTGTDRSGGFQEARDLGVRRGYDEWNAYL